MRRLVRPLACAASVPESAPEAEKQRAREKNRRAAEDVRVQAVSMIVGLIMADALSDVAAVLSMAHGFCCERLKDS